MSAEPRRLLIVTGLQREADIAAGAGSFAVCSGGNPSLLRERLAALGETIGDVAGILSFGLAGGLAPHLRPGDMIAVTHVTSHHGRHDTHRHWYDAIVSAVDSAVTLHRGGLGGSESVIVSASGKRELHGATGALAVDMESHVAAAFAQLHNLPFAAIRAVSDPAHRSLPQLATQALRPDGGVDFVKVLGGIARDPLQMSSLIAAGRDCGRAFAALRRVRGLLGPLFGFRGTDFR
jgi:adenosylhomocysteine nucleosidase